MAASDQTISAAARTLMQQQSAEYRATIARYESEPDPADPNNPLKGEGKVQLLAQARHFEEQRDAARDRGESFDYAAVAAQTGIVLTSVAILLGSVRFVLAGVVAGVTSTLFTLNALAGLIALPFIVN
jgi:hypothetical protein